MQIWSAEIKELEPLIASIKGKSPELEKELEQLVRTEDPNVILLYSRRCLEVIITELCECELKRSRGSEPLKGIIDKLSHEKKVPSNIVASMEGLNTLSTFGTHPKDFDPEQVKPVLNNLTIIIKWYLKYKDTQIISEPKPEKLMYESKVPDAGPDEIQKSKKRLIFLLFGILLVVAIAFVVLFVFDVIGGKKETKELEKSIAVLPFKSLSTDPEKQYLADGMMDAIVLHLSKIEDLRVLSRTSTEQYKESGKTMTEIGRELGVAYLLEGSFQKYGDDVRLIVQLIQAGKEGHVWANQYDRKWNDILSVQSEIAQTIARELDAVITTEEKQLIEKTPTTSLTAYDFFQRGREEHQKYLSDNLSDYTNRESLEKAEDLYQNALEYDSRFAQAYTGLAWVYWNMHYWEAILSENFMDSVLILCDLALSYDDQLSEAYSLKGFYYNEIGNTEQAIKNFDKAVKLNPNDWMAYSGRGSVYVNYDLVKSIEDHQKAISLNHGPQLPGLLRSTGVVYFQAGFIEKAKNYFQEAIKLDGDSLSYYWRSGIYEVILGNYSKSIDFLKKIYRIDSSNTDIYSRLGEAYMFLGQHEEALKYYKKWLEKSETLSDYTLFGTHRVGWAYWQNGYKEEAKYYFNELIKYCDRLKKMERYDPFRPAYDLAAVYAFTGDREKAYENLRLLTKLPVCQLWWITYIKNDPFFNSIRDEPEFQQIVRDMEAKYQAEHERVRKWMEEQGML